ncbi:hypothetical protein KKF29_02050 [Patescibacteria group bacterium]|nr:hypothetical protein [Patescibacteria group bacterium]
MLIAIIITAIITFIIVTLWSKYAYTKGHKSLYAVFTAVTNELDALSQELGFENIHDYWTKKKGQEYADRGMTNIKNTIKFLTES